MGYVAHDLLVVTVSDYFLDRPEMPDLEAWRESLPDEWKTLFVGPVRSVVNGDLTWVFLPDGSKSGWETDTQGDGYRQQLADLCSFRYEDNSSPFDVVSLTYGADYGTEVGATAKVLNRDATADA